MNLLPPTPPLEPGDLLTRDEFERRYEGMPGQKWAELIEAVVYLPSPVRWNGHARPHLHLAGWLAAYEAATPGVEGGDSASVRLDLRNEPQPDAMLIINPARGGQTQLSTDDLIQGAPELVVEVTGSSVSIDLHAKLPLYRRKGVREYLLWRVYDKALDWFVLRESQYDRLPLSAAGFYQSEVFPGLWLDPGALARFDLATVLQILQQGLATPEHAAFVARLRQAGLSNR